MRNQFVVIMLISGLLVGGTAVYAADKCEKAMAAWGKLEAKEDSAAKASQAADKALLKAINKKDEKAAIKLSKKSASARKDHTKALEKLNKARKKVVASCKAECQAAAKAIDDLMPDVVSTGRKLAIMDAAKKKDEKELQKLYQQQKKNNSALEALQKRMDAACKAK